MSFISINTGVNLSLNFEDPLIPKCFTFLCNSTNSPNIIWLYWLHFLFYYFNLFFLSWRPKSLCTFPSSSSFGVIVNTFYLISKWQWGILGWHVYRSWDWSSNSWISMLLPLRLGSPWFDFFHNCEPNDYIYLYSNWSHSKVICIGIFTVKTSW